MEPCVCCGLLLTGKPEMVQFPGGEQFTACWPPNEQAACGCWFCYVCLDRGHDEPDEHDCPRRADAEALAARKEEEG